MKEVFKIVCAAAQSAPKVGDAIGDWIFNCRALSA
tara:strand:+ start:632 stop:736 length:105 start_codon:yes stop_codon:yes gene_type:complete